MTLFELKEKMAELQAQITADAEWIAEKAANPETPMEEIEKKTAHREDVQKRYDLLEDQHDRMETEQRQAVARQVEKSAVATEKDVLIKAKADFYRKALAGQDTSKSYEGLGAIPTGNADLGNGDKLLPTNLASELIMEPVEVNPLRGIARVTNITGLVEPKLGFTIEDSDIADVTDEQTANEIEMEGDSVAYGRMKMKVSATVKDTVYHGSDLDIVGAVENNLRSALAKREKHFAFLSATACGTDTAHAHMSFYNPAAVAEVEGKTMYEAIVKAYADLADDFAANAKIVMRKTDYYVMIESLANTREALFGDKPASILGIPVVFCDKANVPVVGDFSYYGINYDIGAVYETDKDGKKGEYYFILTAWGDQQIRLKSAFRLAKVNP